MRKTQSPLVRGKLGTEERGKVADRRVTREAEKADSLRSQRPANVTQKRARPATQWDQWAGRERHRLRVACNPRATVRWHRRADLFLVGRAMDLPICGQKRWDLECGKREGCLGGCPLASTRRAGLGHAVATQRVTVDTFRRRTAHPACSSSGTGASLAKLSAGAHRLAGAK